MEIERKASFSRCKRYRYQLLRRWEGGHGRCVIVGLNPSTADAQVDDPTVRRCMGFAQDWGFNELLMVNLFAFRTPHPAHLKKCDSPIGPGNRRALQRACESAKRIVVAWGTHGTYRNQAVKFASIAREQPLYCFGLSKNHQPLHPLYQRRDTVLMQYSPAVPR
ncbi:MAG: DUF1643 domain-containing protein [Granulosicoccus sp.]